MLDVVVGLKWVLTQEILTLLHGKNKNADQTCVPEQSDQHLCYSCLESQFCSMDAKLQFSSHSSLLSTGSTQEDLSQHY